MRRAPQHIDHELSAAKALNHQSTIGQRGLQNKSRVAFLGDAGQMLGGAETSSLLIGVDDKNPAHGGCEFFQRLQGAQRNFKSTLHVRGARPRCARVIQRRECLKISRGIMHRVHVPRDQ